jgi:hypothetical protein
MGNFPIADIQAEPKTEFRSFQKQLVNLAVRGLTGMYDAEHKLFCTKVKSTQKGMISEGISVRYTIISLLGFNKLEIQGIRSPVEVQSTLKFLCEHAQQITSIGDLGLLLWLHALAAPKELDRLFSKLNLNGSLVRYKDARLGLTIELSWFLTGLSHLLLTNRKVPNGLKRLAINTYTLIRDNYGGNGIFGHLKKNTIKGMMRYRIGCFADQVYPIYAFTKFAQATGNEEALKIALDCADTIIRLQGQMGQWWWHYDAVTGNLLGQYPVFSVHQDAMAPMALFAIGKVAGKDFRMPIFKGLEWIIGNNELSHNLMDLSRNLIWRSILKPKHIMYFDILASLLKIPRIRNHDGYCKVRLECFPYHLGWILYVFADDKVI